MISLKSTSKPAGCKPRKKLGRTGRARHRRRAREMCPSSQISTQIPDTSPEMIELMRFLKARGFKNSTKLQPVQIEGMGRGMRTKRRLLAGSTIFSLPFSCLLQPSTIAASNPALYNRFKRSREDLLLMHFLYSQRQASERGESAEWAPYIRILPQTYSQQLMPVELLLENDTISSYLPRDFVFMLDERRELFNDYLENFQDLLAAEQTNQANHQGPTQLNFDLFCWAFNVINSRSLSTVGKATSVKATLAKSGNSRFEMADSVVLVPFFDLVNHCPWSGGISRFCTVNRHPVFQFDVGQKRAVSKGEQVMANYHGEKTNRQFYLEYGFIHWSPVPERFLLNLDQTHTVSFVPSPMDFMTINLEELKYFWRFFINHSSPCYTNASCRMRRQLRERNSFILSQIFENDVHEDRALLILAWPLKLIARREEQYVVTLRRDGSFSIFDQNRKNNLPIDNEQRLSYCGRYIHSFQIEVLLWLVSLDKKLKLEAEEKHFKEMEAAFTQKTTLENGFFVLKDGFLNHLTTAKERLCYLHLQLLVVEGLLQGPDRFVAFRSMERQKRRGETSDFLTGSLFVDSDLKDPVELLQLYQASLSRVDGFPEQLVRLFTNEMAMLLMVRRLIKEKICLEKEKLSADERGCFRCTCAI